MLKKPFRTLSLFVLIAMLLGLVTATTPSDTVFAQSPYAGPTATRTPTRVALKTLTPTATKPAPKTPTPTATKPATKTPTRTATAINVVSCSTVGNAPNTVNARLAESSYDGNAWVMFHKDTPDDFLPTKICVLKYGATNWEEAENPFSWYNCLVNEDADLSRCLDVNFGKARKLALANESGVIRYTYTVDPGEIRFESSSQGFQRTKMAIGVEVGTDDTWIQLPNYGPNQVLPVLWVNGKATPYSSVFPDYDGRLMYTWVFPSTDLKKIMFGSDVGFYRIIPPRWQTIPPYAVSTVIAPNTPPKYRTALTISPQ